MTQERAESKILDLSGLRRLAQKAAPGEWWRADWNNNGDDQAIGTSVRDKRNAWESTDYVIAQIGDVHANYDPLPKRNWKQPTAEFITATSPTRVLALLDRVDALEAALRKVPEWGDPPLMRCVLGDCAPDGHDSECPRSTMPEVWEEKQ